MTETESATPAYLEPVVGFRSRKAAQLCAWFAIQSQGCIEKLKLVKLIYLAEREHLTVFEDSMLLDEMYSLPHGPVCSGTLNGIDGRIHQKTWDEFLARNGNIVVAVKSFGRDSLDELSDEEIEIAQKVWAKFKFMTSSQIRRYTHTHCAEYTEVTSGRIPISFEEILLAVGSENSSFIQDEISAMRHEEKVLTQTA